MDGDQPEHLAYGIESRKIEKSTEKSVHLISMLGPQWLQFPRYGG